MVFHDLIFPKKTGKALREAAPYVNEVYNIQYPEQRSKALQSSNSRGNNLGRVVHMTIHSIPADNRLIRCLLFLGYLAVWLAYPLSMKITTIIIALVYSCIEFTFTTIERDGGFTTFAQFFANLLYIPILLEVYPRVVGGLVGSSDVIYVVLFPVSYRVNGVDYLMMSEAIGKAVVRRDGER